MDPKPISSLAAEFAEFSAKLNEYTAVIENQQTHYTALLAELGNIKEGAEFTEFGAKLGELADIVEKLQSQYTALVAEFDEPVLCGICVETDEARRARNRANAKKYKCPHGKRKNLCKLCGGSQLCKEHGVAKTYCIPCGTGGAICPCGVLKYYCVPCKGTGRCECGNLKRRCKKCGGKGLCLHNNRKENCVACQGSQTCHHGAYKSRCRPCGGVETCEHSNRKSTCEICDGSERCDCGNIRARCRACEGSSFCEHNNRKYVCSECNLPGYLVQKQRSSLRRLFNQSDIVKTKSSVEYLGCAVEFFREFITRKMVEGMSWDNIHLDHIKPVAVFDLNDPLQFMECCHYSNFQPLFATENLEKSSKWSEEAETFWRDNIIGQEYIELYNPFKFERVADSATEPTA